MRPSWQIDLKWIAGVFACLAIVASGVLFSLTRMTERETAVPLAGAAIALGVSDRVSDDDYAKLQAAAAANPGGEVSLGPVAVTITGADIAALSKEQASSLVAGKVAGVLYDNGSDAAEALIVQPPAGSDKGAISLGPGSALTAESHSNFQTYFFIAATISVLLLGAVVAMSRGFGRAGAAAFVLALGTTPLVLLWAAADGAVGKGDSGDSPFVQAARQAFSDAAGSLSTTFAVVFAVALVSSVAALIAGIATPLVRRALAKGDAVPAEPAIDAGPLPDAPGAGAAV